MTDGRKEVSEGVSSEGAPKTPNSRVRQSSAPSATGGVAPTTTQPKLTSRLSRAQGLTELAQAEPQQEQPTKEEETKEEGEKARKTVLKSQRVTSSDGEGAISLDKLKEMEMDGIWYRFNDTSVERIGPMTDEMLERECFGGMYNAGSSDGE